jgi:hypothetical protein
MIIMPGMTAKYTGQSDRILIEGDRDEHEQRVHLINIIFRINCIALEEEPEGIKSRREK